MQTFQLSIITWNRSIYDGPVRLCTVTTPEGSIGLEAHHETFLAVLQDDSEVYYKDGDGNSSSVMVKNGILSFENNNCTITVSPAQ